VSLLFWLIVGHVFMDYWAQSDALAQMKNRNRINTRLLFNGKPQVAWPYALTAHALMHGAAVAYLTQNVGLGLAETVAHWLIDFFKCEGWYGIHLDQALHLACKLLWFGICTRVLL
jgi:hypothetical protein